MVSRQVKWVFFVLVGSLAGIYANSCPARDIKKEVKNNQALPVVLEQFQWFEHSRLSWEDFQGPVTSGTEEVAAAATHCGIGIKTNNIVPGNKLELVVYNTFYTRKSWVRNDAKIQSILEHEQGHFDMCELYTRKLRERLSKYDFTTADLNKAVMAIYTEINSEYESRQQAYEQETIHGTDIEKQKYWQMMIADELTKVPAGTQAIPVALHA